MNVVAHASLQEDSTRQALNVKSSVSLLPGLNMNMIIMELYLLFKYLLYELIPIPDYFLFSTVTFHHPHYLYFISNEIFTV